MPAGNQVQPLGIPASIKVYARSRALDAPWVNPPSQATLAPLSLSWSHVVSRAPLYFDEPRTTTSTMASHRVVESTANGLSKSLDTFDYYKNKFVDKVWFEGNGSLGIMLSISDPIRNYYPKVDNPTLGFVVTTHANGDDLLYPNGYGGRLEFDGLNFKTKVDYGYTYINPGNGKDVVVGGYGIDYIRSDYCNGPSSFRIKNPLQRSGNIGTGSKFYVGGSNNDLLDGSSDADFLIGDRFNGHELYLPTHILTKNIPAAFGFHKSTIESFQPYSWTAKEESPDTHRDVA